MSLHKDDEEWVNEVEADRKRARQGDYYHKHKNTNKPLNPTITCKFHICPGCNIRRSAIEGRKCQRCKRK